MVRLISYLVGLAFVGVLAIALFGTVSTAISDPARPRPVEDDAAPTSARPSRPRAVAVGVRRATGAPAPSKI